MEFIDNVWYGPYGGCFISDAFTDGSDHYFEQFCSAMGDPEFESAYEALKLSHPNGPVVIDASRDDDVVVCHVPFNGYPILGSALLASKLGKSRVYAGARNASEALLMAEVCREMNLRLKLFLSKALGGVDSLVGRLQDLGCELDVSACAELFDLPEMYAFQAWNASADSAHMINSRSNVGAFPQTNVTSTFAWDLGRDVAEALKKHGVEPARVVVPVVSGTTALAIAHEAGNARIVCVECDRGDDLVDELDSYCGTLTKVRRNAATDRVLAPELMALVDAGAVERVLAPYPAELVALQPKLSSPSIAALEWARANPSDGVTLCVARDLELGSGR